MITEYRECGTPPPPEPQVMSGNNSVEVPGPHRQEGAGAAGGAHGEDEEDTDWRQCGGEWRNNSLEYKTWSSVSNST